MTDNEIIKALPLYYGGHSCKNCKYDNGKGDDRCGLKGCKVTKDALALINRQKEEIDGLEKELMKCKLEKEMMENYNGQK